MGPLEKLKERKIRQQEWRTTHKSRWTAMAYAMYHSQETFAGQASALTWRFRFMHTIRWRLIGENHEDA